MALKSDFTKILILNDKVKLENCGSSVHFKACLLQVGVSDYYGACYSLFEKIYYSIYNLHFCLSNRKCPCMLFWGMGHPDSLGQFKK